MKKDLTLALAVMVKELMEEYRSSYETEDGRWSPDDEPIMKEAKRLIERWEREKTE